jgi:hypothetical protein
MPLLPSSSVRNLAATGSASAIPRRARAVSMIASRAPVPRDDRRDQRSSHDSAARTAGGSRAGAGGRPPIGGPEPFVAAPRMPGRKSHPIAGWPRRPARSERRSTRSRSARMSAAGHARPINIWLDDPTVRRQVIEATLRLEDAPPSVAPRLQRRRPRDIRSSGHGVLAALLHRRQRGAGCGDRHRRGLDEVEARSPAGRQRIRLLPALVEFEQRGDGPPRARGRRRGGGPACPRGAP